jgi:hypothetical protein
VIVRTFLNEAATLRLIGSSLAEQHDVWRAFRRYLSAESLTKSRRTVKRLVEGPPMAQLAASAAQLRAED